ncbi:MAG: hypothetical protein K2P84_01340 [Undibacterium sp.]|nr:hypothetical protein [Undibacterium sp.]
MFQTKKILTISTIFAAAIGLSACAGVETSKYAYNSTLKVNEITKSSDCYDTSVLLGKNLLDSTDITKKVLAGIDSRIITENNNAIKAERNRHIGLFVGSGGEEIFVNLKDVSLQSTFITVATKTGFVGGAGQKAWSCQIADEMVKMATK